MLYLHYCVKIILNITIITVIFLTVKLYDSDAYLKSFEASVISSTPFESGFKVILDKTAFFPEEGGQYSDRGYLSHSKVFDVQLENGQLVHYCSDNVEGTVKGEIDFPRRFRNMQNHTGEHIISGIIHTLYGGENVGFHLGEDEVTCDYDILLTEEQIAEIELYANSTVYKNLSVSAYYPDEATLKAKSYRSKKEINGDIRIVEIEQTDICACCAPHVKSTGEIGIIKILSSMKLRGGTRLFISCGLDAFKDYSGKHNQTKKISSLLACKTDECAAATAKINDSLKKTVRELNFLKSRLYTEKIKELKNIKGGLFLFVQSDNDTLRNIVNCAKERADKICGAFSGDDQSGYSFIIYSDTLDVNSMAKEITAALGGRGGGRNPMIQGSVKAKRMEIEEFFNQLLPFQVVFSALPQTP